jgi:predicted CXXCH cytochrome family protein
MAAASKPGTRRFLFGCLVAAVALLCCAVLFYGRHEKAARQPSPAQAEYADPATCSRCHAAIAASYRQTGMGRSFSTQAAANRIEDYATHNTVYNQASDRTYTMRQHDGASYLAREQMGLDQNPSNQIEERIDYVIGSGNHARTYLHRTADGALVELPVSWYSEMGGYWAMSPGYDNPHQKDFRRAIGPDCMFCHDGYVTPDRNAGSRNEEAVFSNSLPNGIGCQRCHGPGAAHVKAAMTPGTELAAIRATIVNPSRLGRDRQLDVCRQCHLETTSLPLPNSIWSFDRRPFSFQPGDRLQESVLYFDHKPGTGYDDRLEVAHQAYRLAKSKCFRNTAMTCTTCHDPHQALQGEQAVQHYVAVCLSCHAAPHAALAPASVPKMSGQTCLDCHMWRRRTDDAVHVVMTDHDIQRFKPRRDMLARLTETIPLYQDEVVPYDLEPAANEPDRELYVAVAQVKDGSNLKAGIVRLRADLDRLQPKQAAFYFELGTACYKAGNPTEAIHWLEEALRHRQRYPAALRELSAALLLAGDLPRAAEVGQQAVAVEPADTEALTNLGNIYLRQGRPDQAQAVLQQALALNADLPEANNLLGIAWLGQKDTQKAEAAFRAAIRSQPDMAEAQNNLANLLADREDFKQAAFHLQKAISSDASYADAHHSYGLLLARTRNFSGAEIELNQAVRLQPASAAFRTDLADVSIINGHSAAAEAAYRSAIALDPRFVQAYVGLGNLLTAQGKLQQAAQEYRSAVEIDPACDEARIALESLQTRTGSGDKWQAQTRQATQP